jgi:tRNA pseudouridine38-40 synthase
MTRWKVTLEYDGGGFSGWQRQEHAFSVQQALEEAITKFSGETLTVHVAGRTDAGVHALAQVAHFDLEKITDADTVRDALNYHLKPHPAAVLQAEPVSDDFHARFSAKQRAYRYLIMNRRAPLTIMANRAWHVPRSLDLELMQQAANSLIGHHDFSTFRASDCQAKSPLRTLEQLTVTRHDDMITIETAARSFLYHQVRNMVGTLVLVGHRHWSLADLAAAFAAKDRTKGGPTAPASGLYFLKVSY